MYAIALAVRIKLPKEVAIPLAIIGGIIIALLLAYLFFQKIGKKGTAILGGIVVLYALITLGLGAKRASNQAALAEREEARIGVVREGIEKLGQPSVALRDGCAAAPKMQLAEFGLAHKPRSEVIAVRYRPSYDKKGMHGDDAHVYAYHEDTMSAWGRMATHPFAWGRLLDGSDEDYRLSQLKYVLLVDRDRAALLEMEGGKAICAGKLGEWFSAEHSGYNDIEPALMKPLIQLCEHFEEGGVCEKAKYTANKRGY